MNTAVLDRGLRRIPAWTLYVASLGWAAWLFWSALTGQMGPEPINALERAYGLVALKLLVAGLCISPLRTYAGINLLRFRRAIGLSAFFFVVAHLTVWAVLDVQTFARVWEAIVKRPYVMVGMASFVLLVPLAVTSNNRSIRALGASWRRLHMLTYPAAILAGVHFIWLVKGTPPQPFIYMAVLLGLIALRLPRWIRRS